jgi:hypothetical protein
MGILIKIKKKKSAEAFIFINLLKTKILSGQCRCGNKTGRYGWAEENGRRCNLPCQGNSNEICGGSWANSVYYVPLLNMDPLFTTTSTMSTPMVTSSNISSLFIFALY